MKATARTFLWLYAAFIIIVVVNMISNPFMALSNTASSIAMEGNDPTGGAFPGTVRAIAMALYSLAVVAMIVVTLVIIILRFFRNLLGDEGYLWMTLPVTREQHILAKLLVSVIWTICSTVLIILSIFMLIAATGHFADVVEGIRYFFSLDLPLGRWITIGVIALIVSCFAGVLELYAAMAIGPNIIKNRVGGSILAFIIISIATQFATSGILLGAVRVGFGPPGSWTGPVFSAYPMYSNYAAGTDSLLIGCLISTAVIAVVCWFLTVFMLKRKLNLA